MGKFLLEFALFAGIMCQIYMLAARAYDPESVAQTADSSVTSVHQEVYLDMQQADGPDSFSLAEAAKVTNPMVMQDMAAKEAQRIIQTGDAESFQKQLDANSGLLRLMGYR